MSRKRKYCIIGFAICLVALYVFFRQSNLYADNEVLIDVIFYALLVGGNMIDMLKGQKPKN